MVLRQMLRRRDPERRSRFARRRRPAALPIALAASTVAIIALWMTTAGGEAAPPRVIPRGAIPITVGSQTNGRPIANGFIGFSIEYPSSLRDLGVIPNAPNPVFVQLVRNLLPGQRARIRFGGDTGDWSWWPTPGVRRPGGIKYSVGRRWVAVTHAMAAALNARVTFGINFEADKRAIAAQEARKLLHGIGRKYIDAFELGNEPELYGALGWYENSAGVPVLGRSPGYDFARYLADFRRVSSVLPRGIPLAGPATGSTTWTTDIGRYLSLNPRVRTATYHRYPLRGCNVPTASPMYATIAHLLAPYASTGLAASIAPEVAQAHHNGATFRVDELNSVACGGARGVSDVSASAFWILNTLFSMARVGVDGVNIHTFHGAAYEPFGFNRSHGQWTAQVKPSYYGLLMFAKAAPPGSRLLSVPHPRRPGLRIWATRVPGGAERVLLINVSSHIHDVVAVHPLRVRSGSAQLLRLRAPRLSATSDLTLGGQSFGDSTRSGQLAGPVRTATIRPIKGRYVVPLPPASAALLEIPHP